MGKVTRERIALVVFALLIVLTGIVLFSYFSTGRSWTKAATFVDDTVGAMEGYTAIVYSGVIDPDEKEKLLDDDSSTEGQGLFGQSIINPDFDDTIDEDVVLIEGSPDSVDSSAIPDDGGSFFDQQDEVIELIDPGNTIGLRILSLYPGRLHESYDGVFVSDVVDLYADKDADVVTVSLTDPSSYIEPMIVKAGGKRIGVFSTTNYLSRSRLAKYSEYFRSKDVDVTLCILPRLSLISNFEDIDIALVTEPLDYSSNTKANLDEGTFIVEAPEIGDVGVIVLSSNNIASARVIRNL